MLGGGFHCLGAFMPLRRVLIGGIIVVWRSGLQIWMYSTRPINKLSLLFSK